MREIIFRGKGKDGVWHYGYLVKSKTAFDDNQHVIISIENHFQLTSTPSGSLCFSESETRVNNVMPETIGESSGHTDRNGRKIFEGDVYFMGDFNIKYVVVFHDSGLIGKQIGSSSYAGIAHWKNSIEVIGNIHDNPELL